ncbi:MAG: glycosyltransferase family 2 protein [Patescibacteria group bacterium]
MLKLFVIIPAYNEEKTIAPVVRGVFASNPDAQVVVVDDGSSDKTARLAKESGAVVLQHVINRGQGAALQTGNTYALRAGADVIVHFDADGQFEPREISKLVEPITRAEAEVALGSRFLKNNAIPLSKKYLILPLARLVNFIFTGLWLSDAHNGFRAMTGRAAGLIKINQDRMAHNSEIVRQIKEKKLSFVEAPVTVHYHRYGQGVSGGFKIIKDLLFGKFVC